MRRLMVNSAALIAFVILVGLMAQIAVAEEPPGAKLYTTYCAACHGANGNGGAAPAMAKYLSSNDDAAIAQVIGIGVPTKGMPAWSKSKGGSLTDDQIASIVTYLRSLVGTSGSVLNTTGSPKDAFLIQTRLVLSQFDSASGQTVINALLQEHTGYPIRDASLVFKRATSWGVVDMSTAKTGPDGIATIVLPDIPEAAREVSASFNGAQRFAPSSDKIILEPRAQSSAASLGTDGVMLSLDEPLISSEGSLITPNPPLLPATILVLVVGAIWATYAHVVYQLYAIWRQSRVPRQSTARMNRM